MEQTSNRGENVEREASKKMSNFKDELESRAETVYEQARTKASDAVKGLGDRVSSAGESLRGIAPHSGPASETIGRAVDQVADSLEKTGQYIAEKDLSAVKEDVTTIVRRYPIQSLCIGLGLGVLLGSALKRR